MVPQRISQAFAARIQSRLIDGQYLDWRHLLEVIGEVLRDNIVTQADYEIVVGYCEELYDKHVKPYDIPGIPPLAEAYVDEVARTLIRPAVKALFDNFVPEV